MRTYIIRRLLLMVPTLFIVSLIVFLMIRLIPGDAIDALTARSLFAGFSGSSEAGRAATESMLGLDVPVHVQYGRWIGFVPQADGSFSGILQGNLGNSFWKPDTVIELIARRLPATLELGLMALIIAQLIALPIGVYSALRQDTWGDYIARSFAILAIALPSFWIATMVVVFPSIWWDYMIPIMYVPFLEDPLRNLRMFIVPAIVLGMALAGMTMRMTRSMMLEVLRQDYIRTAWAKGLKERVVVIRHAVKNALIPVVTILGLQIPVMIGGTVIIEQIFVLPGMGRLIIEAVIDRDEQLISGVVLIYAGVIVLVNLITDLTYAYLDPRIRYK